MRALVTVVFCLLAQASFAAPVTWTLENGLAGALPLTGSFAFDADAGLYSDIDIYQNGGASPILTDANLDESGSTASTLVLDLSGFQLSYVFSFETPLSNAGGVVNFSGYVFDESEFGDLCGGLAVCANLSGQVVASVVPIPAAAWLFGSALAGLGWSRRRP